MIFWLRGILKSEYFSNETKKKEWWIDSFLEIGAVQYEFFTLFSTFE